MKKTVIVIFAFLAILPGFGCGKGGDKSQKKPSPTVQIKGQTFQVDLAMTEKDRYRGLSGRDSLPADYGMLFIYPKAKNLRFCMRDCNIPIDIVFIGPDMRVVNVYQMQVESDRAGTIAYESNLLVHYALELKGGQARRAGIAIGDKVTFANVPSPEKALRGN